MKILTIIGVAIWVLSTGGSPAHANEDRDTLKAFVRAEIARAVAPKMGVGDIRLPRRFPQGDVRVQWRGAPKIGTQNVLLLATNGQEVVQRGWARVELHALQKVVVARHDLAQGHIIRATDLRLEDRSVSRTLQGGSDRIESFVGGKIVMAVAKGETLKPDAIVATPPLGRGAPVRIEVHSGRLIVTTSGVLEQNAHVGQMVLVRGEASKTPLRGRLVSEDLVVIEGGQ